jgi:hypothetical protein
VKDKEALQNRLKADIDQYELMIEDELVRKKELLSKVAIVGGIIIAGYALTKMLVEKENEKQDKVKKGSSVGKLILGIATPIVINFLKDKLSNRA